MAGKEAAVLIVDVNPTMGVLRRDAQSGLDMAKHALSLLVQQKLIFPRQDELGVVLVGTDAAFNDLHDQDASSYDHIKVIQPIAKPDLSFLSTIDDIEAENSHGDVVDALLVAMELLHRRVGKYKFTKRIFLITNAASPIAWSAEELEPVCLGVRTSDYRINVIGVDFQDVLQSADDDEDIPMVRHPSEVDRRSAQQKANERLLRDFVDQVDGTTSQVSDAIALMSRLRKRVMQVTKYRGPLEIGDVKIQVATYTQTALMALPTMKKELVRTELIDDGDGNGGGGGGGEGGHGDDGAEQAEPEGIRQERVYWDKSADKAEEVAPDMRVKGFRYGKDHVPFGEDELELLKYECDKCLVLLAFTESENVGRWQYMSAVDCVAPEKGDVENAIAFSALVYAMFELSVVALCRFVARKDARPQLVALIPSIVEHEGVRLHLIQLPFAEDIRDFSFASFDSNPAHIPNDTQRTVAKDLITAMSLNDRVTDEDGHLVPALQPEDTWNPVLQRFYATVQQRAQDPTCELPALDDDMARAVVPDTQVVKGSERALRGFHDALPLTVIPKADKREKRKFSMYDDDQLMDEDVAAAKRVNAAQPSSTASQPAARDPLLPMVDKVGSVTPLADFRAMIARRDDRDVYKRAWDELQALIERYVDDSYGDAHYRTAMDCIVGLRAAAVAEKEADRFNSWMESVRERWRARRTGWWSRLKEAGVGVIHDGEVDDSRYTAADAERWMDDVDHSSKVRGESLPPSVDDEPDLFSSMD